MRAEQRKLVRNPVADESVDLQLLLADQGRADCGREHEGEAVEQDLPPERGAGADLQPFRPLLGQAVLPGQKPENRGR